MPHMVTDINGLLELMKKLQGDKTQQEYAESLGVSPQYLSDVYNCRRDPGPRITENLGVTATTNYVIPDNLTKTFATSSQGDTHAEGRQESKKAARIKVEGRSRKRSN